jgi:hypothetical protein
MPYFSNGAGTWPGFLPFSAVWRVGVLKWGGHRPGEMYGHQQGEVKYSFKIMLLHTFRWLAGLYSCSRPGFQTA